MSFQDQNQQVMNMTGMNQAYLQSSALEVRLDTKNVLDDIEMWLRGSKKVIQQDEDGTVSVQTIPLGKPKCNEMGIQSILSLVSSVLNSQFVQGNFTNEERYDMFVAEYHDSILWNVWINLFEWGVAENDYEVVVDHIVQMMIGFSSRLISNKERESYENTIRTIENSTLRESSGNKGFNLFGGKNQH